MAPEAARASLGADPLGHEARTGEVLELAGAVGLAREAAAHWPGVRALAVDALPYHEAGGSAAEELGLSLATGVAYLRALTGAGSGSSALGVQAALGQLEFRYAATADQFLTIAKFRAARRLWARIAEACGAPEAGAQRQHAVTSPVMMTRRDPWVNMLRTTVACMAAGVGGADSVTVLPFDHELGLPDAFARRISRNTSTILLEESHLARVIDPAGGSYYVEQLTDELAHAAWEFFQEIEKAGGLAATLRSGLVADRLAATWAERSKKLAKRREPITGVSEFPLLSEKPSTASPPRRPDRRAAPRTARRGVRGAARPQRRAPGRDREPPADLPRRAGPGGRAHRARHLRREPVPGGRHRGGARPGVGGRGDGRRGLRRERRGRHGRAVLQRRAVPGAGRGGGRGPARGRCDDRVPRGQARHVGGAVDEYVFAGCDAVAVLSSVLDRMGIAL